MVRLLSLIGLLVGCIFASFAVLADDARDPALLKQIGAAAYAAIQQQPAQDRFTSLMRLADAEIAVGDLPDARTALTAARPMVPPIKDNPSSYTFNRLVAALVGASDDATGMALVKTLSGADEIRALGSFGQAEANKDDTKSAWEAVDALDAVVRTMPPGDAKDGHGPPDLSGTGLPDTETRHGYDAALWQIGDAFARRDHDVMALGIANKISNQFFVVRLLGRIALAKDKSGDRDAAIGFLEKIKTIANSAQMGREAILKASAEAFAACGDAVTAQALITAMPAGRQANTFADAAMDAAKNGHPDQALSLLHAGGDDPDDFVNLAKILEAQGDMVNARAAVASAAEIAAARPRPNRFDQDRVLYSVVGAQIDAGLYADAIAQAMKIDPANRDQFLKNVIRAAARQKDMESVRNATIAMGKSAQDAGLPAQAVMLAALARTLAEADCRDYAKAVLDESRPLLSKVPDTAQARMLADFAFVEAYLGDTAAAAASHDQLDQRQQQVDRRFMAQASTSDHGRIADAVRNLNETDTNDKAKSEAALQRALQNMGGNAAALEGLAFMSRPSPGRDRLNKVEQRLDSGDVDGAEKEVEAMHGMTRDSALEAFSGYQERHGNVNAAFEALRRVEDPAQRAFALTDLLTKPKLGGSD